MLDLNKAAEIPAIDVRDWRDQVIASEKLITSNDDMFAQVAAGEPTGEIAKRVIISQLLETTPLILRPHKLLVYTGAVANVISLIHARRKAVRVVNGTEYNAPQFVGLVSEPQDNGSNGDENTFTDEAEAIVETGPSYVELKPGNVEARNRAEKYLQKQVPGYTWSRFLILHETGGDVRQEAARLKNEIDDQVKRILSTK